MAVYKVIQDIEAEDKLLGWLTLKQFVYAGIAALMGFINFKLITSPAIGTMRWVFLIIFGVPMLLFGILASPLGKDQPTEVWIISHLRFLLKPHLRLWNQSGIKELVTITVPKKVEKQLTKSFSQTEVQSRLKALASVLDSHGWVVKNLAEDPYAHPVLNPDSDRLVPASSLAAGASSAASNVTDILDEHTSDIAQKFSNLLKISTVKHKESIKQKIDSQQHPDSAASPSDLFPINQPEAVPSTGATVVPTEPPHTMKSDEEVRLKHIEAEAEKWRREHEQKASLIKRHNLSAQPRQPATQKAKAKPVTSPQQTAKLKELSQPDNQTPLTVKSVSSLANSTSPSNITDITITVPH